MILRVNVNLPENTELLTAKAAEVVAKILVNKLDTREMEHLIRFLQKGDEKLDL